MNYNEWENRGWSDMEGLLDKHMPLERKRRGIWLFFLLFLCTTGGALAYLGFQNSYTENDPIKLSNELTHQLPDLEPSAENIEVSKDATEQQINRVTSTARADILNLPDATDVTAISKKLQPHSAAMSQEMLERPLEKTSATNSVEQIINELSPNSTTKGSKESIESSFTENSRDKTYLSSLGSVSIEGLPITPFLLTPKSIIAKQHKPFSLALESSVLFRKSRVKPMYTLGVSVSKYFTKNQIGAGIGYFSQLGEGQQLDQEAATAGGASQIRLENHSGIYGYVGYNYLIFSRLYASAKLGYQLDLAAVNTDLGNELEFMDSNSFDPLSPTVDQQDRFNSDQQFVNQAFSTIYNDIGLQYRHHIWTLQLSTRYYWNLPRQYDALNTNMNWRINLGLNYRITP